MTIRNKLSGMLVVVLLAIATMAGVTYFRGAAIIAGLAVVLAIATTLVLVALRDQIVFFYSPSDVMAREVAVY